MKKSSEQMKHDTNLLLSFSALVRERRQAFLRAHIALWNLIERLRGKHKKTLTRKTKHGKKATGTK